MQPLLVKLITPDRNLKVHAQLAYPIPARVESNGLVQYKMGLKGPGPGILGFDHQHRTGRADELEQIRAFVAASEETSLEYAVTEGAVTESADGLLRVVA